MTLTTAVVMLSALMLAAWFVALRARNGGWTDVFWTASVGVTGIWVALAPVAEVSRPLLVAAMIGAWALRLALHLSIRVSRAAEDFRYARLRALWSDDYARKLLGFLQLQAAFAIPLVVAIHLAATRAGPFPDAADVLAITILLIAIVGAATADRQLAAFASSANVNGRVLDRGLWAWSRHPNFFFEWLGWCAWPVIAIGPHLAWWPGALALGAPMTMYYVLVHITGIPPIEQRMLTTRGDAFRAYQRRVPAFFPRPPRKRPDAA